MDRGRRATKPVILRASLQAGDKWFGSLGGPRGQRSRSWKMKIRIAVLFVVLLISVVGLLVQLDPPFIRSVPIREANPAIRTHKQRRQVLSPMEKAERARELLKIMHSH